MSVRRNKIERMQEDREKSGKERRGTTDEKSGNRETAGTPGHGGWIAPC